MVHTIASLERRRQSGYKKADEPAAPTKLGPYLSRTDHSLAHSLHLETGLPVAREVGAEIREGA